MNATEHKEKLDLIADMILGSYICSTNNKDQMKVPLMVDVSASWAQTMKEICASIDLDFAPTLESVIYEIFQDGLVFRTKYMQKKYNSPTDLLEKFMRSQ